VQTFFNIYILSIHKKNLFSESITVGGGDGKFIFMNSNYIPFKTIEVKENEIINIPIP
jgi:hypothetical protein